MDKHLVCIEIKAAAAILRAVDHKLRQDILALLERKKKLNVSEMVLALNIEQSVCSSHLKILREAGVVAVERASKNRFYYIVHNRLQKINVHAKALVCPD